MINNYTLSVELKNEVGALERVLGVLRRRAINVDRLTLSKKTEKIYEVIMSVTDQVVEAGSDRVVKELTSLFVVVSAQEIERF
ncbi:MAG: ACT domain-containing protein [Gemmatimonadetes bacterium]|jgi:acetolactate synthase small subunit|nr:ACT domain-containing protein [Gemmatimonadota bacterium]|tara:strand:- start:5147 stop:5395 length:249 start_codon:yes stop_codon:yes gene_type:complete